MKIHTTTHAQEKLDDEFAWRLKEIADLKSSIRTSKPANQKSMLRAGLPMLYAHWEGFVKNAAEIYLNFVVHQKLPYSDLRTCFIVWGLKGELNKLISANNFEMNIAVVDFVLNELESKASFSSRGVIETMSNLNSKVFQNIAISIGIDYVPYETKFKFIDEIILGRRNRIAHGSHISIPVDEYDALSNEVLALLRRFKTDVENAIILELYKR